MICHCYDETWLAVRENFKSDERKPDRDLETRICLPVFYHWENLSKKNGCIFIGEQLQVFYLASFGEAILARRTQYQIQINDLYDTYI